MSVGMSYRTGAVRQHEGGALGNPVPRQSPCIGHHQGDRDLVWHRLLDVGEYLSGLDETLTLEGQETDREQRFHGGGAAHQRSPRRVKIWAADVMIRALL